MTPEMIDMLVYKNHQQVMRVIYKYQIVFYLVWLVGFFLGLSGWSNSLGWVFYLQLVDFTCNKNSLYLVSSQFLSKDVSKESIILHGFDSSTQILCCVQQSERPRTFAYWTIALTSFSIVQSANDRGRSLCWTQQWCLWGINVRGFQFS